MSKHFEGRIEMSNVKVYTTSWCSYCKSVKRLLSDRGIEFQEIDIERSGISRGDLARITGGFTVPQIVIGGRSIGGFEELFFLAQNGELDGLNGDDSRERVKREQPAAETA